MTMDNCGNAALPLPMGEVPTPGGEGFPPTTMYRTGRPPAVVVYHQGISLAIDSGGTPPAPLSHGCAVPALPEGEPSWVLW